MVDITPFLIFVVAGGFSILLTAAVGFFIGESVGSGLRNPLASIFTTFGLTRDDAFAAADAVESVALLATLVVVDLGLVLFFSQFFIGGVGHSSPLIFAFRLLLVDGSAAVLLAVMSGLVVGTMRTRRASRVDRR